MSDDAREASFFEHIKRLLGLTEDSEKSPKTKKQQVKELKNDTPETDDEDDPPSGIDEPVWIQGAW